MSHIGKSPMHHQLHAVRPSTLIAVPDQAQVRA